MLLIILSGNVPVSINSCIFLSMVEILLKLRKSLRAI